MSIQLHISNPDLNVKLVPATKIVKGMKKEFNDFKNNIDRKYCLYTIFGGMRKEFGYTVEKLVGSSQVILTKTTFNPEPKTVVLYDSGNEGELADPEKFEQFVLKELRRILRKARRMQNVR